MPPPFYRKPVAEIGPMQLIDTSYIQHANTLFFAVGKGAASAIGLASVG